MNVLYTWLCQVVAAALRIFRCRAQILCGVRGLSCSPAHGNFSSPTRDQTHVPYIGTWKSLQGRFLTTGLTSFGKSPKESLLELFTPMADLSPLSHCSGSNLTAAFMLQRKFEPRGPLVRVSGEARGDQLVVQTSFLLLGESDEVL